MTASYNGLLTGPRRIHYFATRKALKRLVLLGALLVLPVACSLHTPPSQGGDLREKIFNAYGGRDRLLQIGSIAAEGTITALVRGEHGVYRRALRRDGKLYVDIQYTQSREMRLLSGKRALRGIDGKIESVSGSGYLAMVYQYNELSMPFALLDNSFTVRDLGRDPASVPVRILRCTDRAGNSIDVFVNEVTYRIVKTSGSFSVDGESTNLSAEFGDFRFVDGVLAPFRIINYAGGIRISDTIIDDYRFNIQLSDAMFDPHAHTRNQSRD